MFGADKKSLFFGGFPCLSPKKQGKEKEKKACLQLSSCYDENFLCNCGPKLKRPQMCTIADDGARVAESGHFGLSHCLRRKSE